MRILDRYILGEFVRALLGIAAFFACVLLLKEGLSSMSTIVAERPDPYQVALYLLNRMPAQFYEVAPVAVLLAMMFSVGAMAKRKELQAMHAGGVSYGRLALPLALALGAVTVGLFAAGELVIPRCEQRARYIEKIEIQDKGMHSMTRNKNITTKGVGNRFYEMESFDSASCIMEHPSISETTEDGRSLRMRIDALWAERMERESSYAPGAGGRSEGYSWRFHDAVRWTFDETGRLVNVERFARIDLPMEEDLERFLDTSKKVNEMNSMELRDFARILARRSRTGEYALLRAELHRRFSFPLAVLLLGLLAYTFAVRSSIRSLVLEFGLALTAMVAYYALLAVGEKGVRIGLAPPFAAVWFTNVVFAGLLGWRFRHLHQIPKH